MIKLVELQEFPKELGTEFICIFKDGSRLYNGCIGAANYKIAEHGIKVYSIDSWVMAGLDMTSIIKILALPHAELRAKYKNTGSNYEDWQRLNHLTGAWVGSYKEPEWTRDSEYRYNPIKKKLVKKYLWSVVRNNIVDKCSDSFYTEEEIKSNINRKHWVRSNTFIEVEES